nr:uncharacterized protein LOC123495020 [Aegilops tauschii subsp. strangulata]
MEPGRAVRVLPSCNRAFHQDCVDRWLAISPGWPPCSAARSSSSGRTAPCPPPAGPWCARSRTCLCVAKEDGGEFACKSIPKRKRLARVGSAARAALLLPVLIKAGERRGTASRARWRGLRRDHRGVFLASPSS